MESDDFLDGIEGATDQVDIDERWDDYVKKYDHIYTVSPKNVHRTLLHWFKNASEEDIYSLEFLAHLKSNIEILIVERFYDEHVDHSSEEDIDLDYDKIIRDGVVELLEYLEFSNHITNNPMYMFEYLLIESLFMRNVRSGAINFNLMKAITHLIWASFDTTLKSNYIQNSVYESFEFSGKKWKHFREELKRDEAFKLFCEEPGTIEERYLSVADKMGVSRDTVKRYCSQSKQNHESTVRVQQCAENSKRFRDKRWYDWLVSQLFKKAEREE